MAVLTKAQLRTAIDAVFASMQKISAEQARGEYHDWIDSLLDGESVVAGSGITVSRSAGVVTVAAGGAAAATGLPSFVMTGAAQPSDDVLTASITGVTNSPPFPSVVYLITPSGLNRAAVDLELRVNGDVSRVRSLVDFQGDALTARDLDPAALYELLAHASPNEQYRLTEPIPQRRQDFDVAVFWSTDNLDTETVNATEYASLQTFGTPVIDTPAMVGGDRGYRFIGVPNEAPNIAPDVSRVWSFDLGHEGDGRLRDDGIERVPAAEFAGQVGGVTYKWFRHQTRQGAEDGDRWGEGRVIRLEYLYL